MTSWGAANLGFNVLINVNNWTQLSLQKVGWAFLEKAVSSKTRGKVTQKYYWHPQYRPVSPQTQVPTQELTHIIKAGDSPEITNSQRVSHPTPLKGCQRGPFWVFNRESLQSGCAHTHLHDKSFLGECFISVPSERWKEQEYKFKDIFMCEVCVQVCVSVLICELFVVHVCACVCIHMRTSAWRPWASSSADYEFHTHFISCSQHQFKPSEELTLSTCLSFSLVAPGAPHTLSHSFSFEGFQSPLSVCREDKAILERRKVTVMDGVHSCHTLLYY